MALIKMRLCRAYSNLPKTMKLVWNEYKIVRAEWKRLEERLHNMEKPKPRYTLDTQTGRPRIMKKITHWDELYKAYMNRGLRLLELALYLRTEGYIAPDFTREDLDKPRA